MKASASAPLPASHQLPGALGQPSRPRGPRVEPEARRPVGRVGARGLVGLLLFLALVQQLVLVVVYPPFQGHDELAHYGYVRTLAHARRLPTLYDNLPAELAPYSRYALDWPASYEALQPPLYYLLAWPAFALAPPRPLAQLYATRLVSIPLFLATIWVTYLLASALAPDDDLLALTAPALIAFQPQLSFEGAIVDNDALTVLLGALLTFLLVRGAQRGLRLRDVLWLGLVGGAALLTKLTLAALLPLAGVVVLWSALRAGDGVGGWRADARDAGARLAALLLPIALLALPWYHFLWRTYGDLTGLRALDLLESTWDVPDSLRQLLSLASLRERLHEAWGYYGWKLLSLNDAELRLIWLAHLILGAVAVGALLRFARAWRRGERPVAGRAVRPVLVLVAVVLLMYGAMLSYGLKGGITQARYVFPAAPAAAVLAMLALREVLSPRWRPPVAAVVFASALAFQIWLLVTLVIPYGLS